MYCKLAEQLGPEHDHWYKVWFEASNYACTTEAILRTDLFNILISSTDKGSSASLQMIRNWESEGHTAIHRDLDRLEKQADRNIIQEVQSCASGEEQTHSPD